MYINVQYTEMYILYMYMYKCVPCTCRSAAGWSWSHQGTRPHLPSLCHECQRVFHDRLINKTDKKYFYDILSEMSTKHFSKVTSCILTCACLLLMNIINTCMYCTRKLQQIVLKSLRLFRGFHQDGSGHCWQGVWGTSGHEEVDPRFERGTVGLSKYNVYYIQCTVWYFVHVHLHCTF